MSSIWNGVPKPDRSGESIPKRVPGGNRPRRREMHAGFLNGRSPDSLRGAAGRHPPGALASRPHPLPADPPVDVAGGHCVGRAQGAPWSPFRLIEVGESGLAAPSLVQGGTPALPGGVSRDVVELCGITRPGRPADSCRCRRNSMPRCMTHAASQGLRRVVSSCGPRLESRTKLFQ